MNMMKKIWKWINATRLRKFLSLTLALLIFFTSIRFIFLKPKLAYADSTVGFNEGYGTTVSDNNGNISGTITNAVWKNEEFCKIGKCLYFDGTGDYVSFGDDSDLDFAAATNFTIEGWFRTPDITSGTRVIVAKHNATAAGYKVYIDSNGYVIFGIDDDSTFTPDDSASTSTTAFDDNKWHHFAAVKTGTTSISIYVDGTLYQTDSSIAATGTLVNSDTFYIGIDGDGSSNGFSGFIDEVKVYSTSARSATEIKSDINSETSSRGTSATFAPDNSYLTNGLLGYWKLDETSGNASDYSGNGLTLTNNATTTYLPGKFGNGSEHVPASSQYFSTATTINGVKSVSFWTNPDSTTNYYISLTSSAYITSSSGTLSATGFTSPKIYVNGIETTTVAADAWQLITVTTDSAINADTFYIGRQGSNYYDGTMDDVRIYNRNIPQNEIQRLYAFAPGPIGWWKLDDNTGTTANDSSGNDNSATLTNTPTWSSGKFGQSVSFAGSDQHITRADDSDFDFIDDADMTYSTWFKHSAASAQEIIISKFNEAGYKMIMESDGDITCALDYDSTWTPTDSITSTAATYDDGNWHYLSCVKLGATSLSLYIDGTLIGSDSSLTATNTLTNSDPIYFGIDADGTSNDFTGSLDDIKIYNYARNTEQVVEDMNGGHPAGGSPVGSPIIHWNFDENTGTVANNSGNTPSTTGTLSTTGMWETTSTNCKLSGCLNLNFSGGSVSALDTLFTDALTQMTISMWLRPASLAINGNIVSKTNFGSQNSFLVRTDATNSDEIRVYIASTLSDTANYFLTSNLDLANSTYAHIAIIYDGTLAAANRVKVYKNGNPVSGSITGTIPASLTSNSTSNFKVGDRDGGGNNALQGRYDEFKFYNFALSDSERLVDMNVGSAASFGGQLGSQNFEALGPTTRALWLKMDENTGSSTTSDYSGNERNMTMTNMNNNNWLPGKFGSALNFDGSTQYINRTSAVISSFNNVSFTAWVKPDNTNTGTIYMQGVTGAAFPYFAINYESGAIILRSANDAGTTLDASAASTGTLTANQWNFIMVSKTSGTVVTYNINGVISTTSITNTGTFTTTSSTVGALHRNTDTQYFDGTIDEVQAFTKGLSTIEVQYLYNRATPLIWYKLDDCTGTTANNSILNANGQASSMNGTITIGATGSNTTAGTCTSGTTTEAWNNGNPGKYNYSLDFDGTDDYIENADDNQLDFNDTSFTLEAWVNRDTFTTDDTIIAKKNDRTSATVGYLLWIDATTDDFNFIATEGFGGTDTYTINGRTQITGTGWHHIVIVWDDTTSFTATMYVDGKVDGESTTGTFTSVGNISNSVTLRIGEESDGGQPFDGKIDNVKLYRYAMPATLIPRLYNEGMAQRFGP